MSARRSVPTFSPRVALAAAALIALGACCGAPPADDGPCRCVPGNASHTRSLGDASPMDGRGLLDRLRRHKSLIDDRRPPRDVKVFDDELRHAIIDFCQPCSDWVGERLTMEQMFPLARLGDATSAVCMGLILRDGTLAYGDARPRACR